MSDIISMASQQFWTNPAFIAAFVAALAYLAFQWKDARYGFLARTMVVFSALMLLIIYNPLFSVLASKFNAHMSNYAVYARIFLLLPLFPAMVCAIVILWEKERDRLPAHGTVLLLLFAVVMIAFGTTVGDNKVYIKAHNIEKLNANAVEISNMVRKDAPAGQRPHIYLQTELSTFRDDPNGGVASGIREYYSDALISRGFPNDEVYQAKYNLQSYAADLKKTTANDTSAYVVLYKAPQEKEALQAAGGKLIGTTTQDAEVYKVK